MAIDVVKVEIKTVMDASGLEEHASHPATSRPTR